MQPIHGLTSIRGVAAWWIVLYHFQYVLPAGIPVGLNNFVMHGYLAVDLFFILSGFVIALNYADRFRRFSLRQAWQFLGLRLARIYPLHITILLIFIVNPIVILLFSDEKYLGDRYSIEYFLLSVVLMQNWGFTQGLAWNIPAWSISTEWFAYLLFPGLIWLSARVARSASRAAGLAVLLLVVLAAITAASGVGLGDHIESFGLVRCVIEFWVGICLFYVHQCRSGLEARDASVAVAMAIMCFAGFVWIRIPEYVIIPAGFGLLIYGLGCNAGIIARILGSRTLILIGELSYSTYLVHFLVKDWVKFLLVEPGIPNVIPFVAYFGITAAMSVLLYQFVEVPGRRVMRAFVLGRRVRQLSSTKVG